LKIVVTKVGELQTHLSELVKIREDLHKKLDKYTIEIDEKCKQYGKIELETELKKQETAKVVADTNKVNAQTKVEQDAAAYYITQVAKTKIETANMEAKMADLRNQILDAEWDVTLTQEDLQQASDDLQPALVAFNFCSTNKCYDDVRVGVPGAGPPQPNTDKIATDAGLDKTRVISKPDPQTGKVVKVEVADMQEIPFNAGEFACPKEACLKEELGCVQKTFRDSTKEMLIRAARGFLNHFKAHPTSDFQIKMVGSYHCGGSGNPSKSNCLESYKGDAAFKKAIETMKYDDPFSGKYKFNDKAKPSATDLSEHVKMIGYPNLKKGYYYDMGKCRAAYIAKFMLAEAAKLGFDKGVVDTLTKNTCSDGYEYFLPMKKVALQLGKGACA